nr:MAG TPA: hypothetical protein [Caudoviricetes sp.]
MAAISTRGHAFYNPHTAQSKKPTSGNALY